MTEACWGIGVVGSEWLRRTAILHTIVYVCKARHAADGRNFARPRGMPDDSRRRALRQAVVVSLHRPVLFPHEVKENRLVVRRTKDEAQETRNAILDSAE